MESKFASPHGWSDGGVDILGIGIVGFFVAYLFLFLFFGCFLYPNKTTKQQQQPRLTL